jgi:hypothetical protein
MPAWIHDRAEHILAKNPSMSKSTAFAIATQQSHKLGKSPKGYGTAQGKREAKAKYDKPKKEYVKGSNPGGLESSKMAEDDSIGARIKKTIESMYSGAKSKAKKVKEKGKQLVGRLGQEMVDISKVQTPYRYVGKKSVELAPKGLRPVVPKEIQEKWKVKESQFAAFLDELATGGNDPEFHCKVAAELEQKGVDALTKDAFQYAHYAGPRGEGYRPSRLPSDIPPKRAPPIEKKGAVGVGAPMTRSQYSGPLSLGAFKMVSGIPPWSEPGLARKGGVPLTPEEESLLRGRALRKSAGLQSAIGSMGPAARLKKTQAVAGPKTTGFTGPSIADVSKPDFGPKLHGTLKNRI